MPRANRFFLPGHVWHITHRCHSREFLLKFSRDRQRWRHWLFEARKRYGLCVLNYIVTSNHIHLLVHDQGRGEIPKSMQLVAGRTAQEYNQRKQRRGAYWEDRYHATAVEKEQHLARCMVYIDLNMVRAGAVSHPKAWDVCGYNELQNPPERYRIIDRAALAKLLNVEVERLSVHLRQWMEQALGTGKLGVGEKWSSSLAVGSEEFVTQFRSQLGSVGFYREIEEGVHGHQLSEPSAPYGTHFLRKTERLSAEGTVFWEERI
jgi:putative transposase